MQARLVKIESKWQELVYTSFGGKKMTFLNLLRILTLKIQIKTNKIRRFSYVQYLKNYDIRCWINSSAKSNNLFWYYIKQVMYVFIHAMVRIFSFGVRWNVLFNSAIASLNGTFHLSPHENILTIALINIHYLYNIIPKQAIAFQEQFMKQLSRIIIFNACEKRRISFVFLCSHHFECLH